LDRGIELKQTQADDGTQRQHSECQPHQHPKPADFLVEQDAPKSCRVHPWQTRDEGTRKKKENKKKEQQQKTTTKTKKDDDIKKMRNLQQAYFPVRSHCRHQRPGIELRKSAGGIINNAANQNIHTTPSTLSPRRTERSPPKK
jgi:hypothetical protein